MKPTTVLTVLTGGGFLSETRALLDGLEPGQRAFLATIYGMLSNAPDGPKYLVPMFETVTRRSKIKCALAFLITFAFALQVIRWERVGLVICVGSSHSVPILLAARLLRRRSVFVESITRANDLSGTGKLVYRLKLADRFYVQWPELQAAYPTVLLGTIL